MRLDLYLAQNKLVKSRTKADDLIKEGKVLVNDIAITKASYNVTDEKITITSTDDYVSRGAYKLLDAIKKWKLDLNNKIVFDIGASTGGFTQVCLECGCAKVYAIDVGTNQLDETIRQNKKVISLENTNVKDLPLLSIDDIPEIVVADLSFISLTFLIDALVKKYNHHYQCIFLIKPQFELSQKEVQNGLVKSKVLRRKAVDKIKNYSTTNGFIVDGIIESPIKGKKMGNTEYLICLHK